MVALVALVTENELKSLQFTKLLVGQLRCLDPTQLTVQFKPQTWWLEKPSGWVARIVRGLAGQRTVVSCCLESVHMQTQQNVELGKLLGFMLWNALNTWQRNLYLIP